MPGGLPLGLDVCNGNSTGTSSSLGTAVTCAGSANTKGSWAQLVASTPNDTVFVDVVIYFNASAFSAAGQQLAVDIGVGAGGSEVVIANNLMNVPGYTLKTGVHYAFPLAIPAGTRIAARAQASVASAVANVSINLFDGSFTQMEGIAAVDSIGFQAGTTRGVTLTPNASANTMGSYAQLVASSSVDYMGIMAAFDYQGGAFATQNWLVDIAIGAGGSEVVVVPQLFTGGGGANAFGCPVMPFIPLSIPAGTRIAARCQSSAASGAAIGATLFGVYQ